jgi:prepilin-type processing-associated H-X9-DG protein
MATGYNYNPHALNTSATGHGPDWGDQPAYTKLEQFGDTHPVVVDLLTLWRSVDVAHVTPSVGWNLLYADGHVEFKASRATYDYVLAKLSTDDWQLFRTALNRLETGPSRQAKFMQIVLAFWPKTVSIRLSVR